MVNLPYTGFEASNLNSPTKSLPNCTNYAIDVGVKMSQKEKSPGIRR